MRPFQLRIFRGSVAALLHSAGVCSALDLSTKLKLLNAARREVPLSSLLSAEPVLPRQTKSVWGHPRCCFCLCLGIGERGDCSKWGPAWKCVSAGAGPRREPCLGVCWNWALKKLKPGFGKMKLGFEEVKPGLSGSEGSAELCFPQPG